MLEGVQAGGLEFVEHLGDVGVRVYGAGDEGGVVFAVDAGDLLHDVRVGGVVRHEAEDGGLLGGVVEFLKGLPAVRAFALAGAQDEPVALGVAHALVAVGDAAHLARLGELIVHALDAEIQQIADLRVGVHGVEEDHRLPGVLAAGADGHHRRPGGGRGGHAAGRLHGDHPVAEGFAQAGVDVRAAAGQAEEHLLVAEPGEGGADAGVGVDVARLIVPAHGAQQRSHLRLLEAAHQPAAVAAGLKHQGQGLRDVLVAQGGHQVIAGGIQEQRDILRLVLRNHAQQGQQGMEGMVLGHVDAVFLHQLPVEHELQGHGQLLVGGHAPDLAVDLHALPEFLVDGGVHVRPLVLEVGGQVQPCPGQGVGLVVVRPGEGDVKGLVGIEHGGEVIVVLVPADLPIIDGKAVFFRQYFVQRVVHQNQVPVRLADGVVVQHHLRLGPFAALRPGGAAGQQQRRQDQRQQPPHTEASGASGSGSSMPRMRRRSPGETPKRRLKWT